MNYCQPREIADKDGAGAGRWRYTCMNDGRVWAIGYCATLHCHHASPEEAREHYRQYELDHRREVEYARPGRLCLICEAVTVKGFTTDGYHSYPLCDEHRTRKVLDTLVKPGDFISS
jgi:hypothetical protein